MVKSSTEPCVRGSSVTADIIATLALSRERAARKNWLSICCSGGREQAASSSATAISRSVVVTFSVVRERDMAIMSSLWAVRVRVLHRLGGAGFA